MCSTASVYTCVGIVAWPITIKSFYYMLRHFVGFLIHRTKTLKFVANSRKTWQTINELTSRKSVKESVTSLKVNGVSTANPTMLSNEFNNNFATIGSKLACNINTSDSDNYLKYLTNIDKQFQLCATTTGKVLSLLNKLNKSKATGLDMISARLIRKMRISFAYLFAIFLIDP